MVNGIKASISTIDLIMMVIVIIWIQIQISNLPATGLAIWIETEIMKMTGKNKRSITHGCTSRQKHKRDYSSGNESNSNDIHPVGPSKKDGNILTTKVMKKVMPTKGMRSILTRKVLRKVTPPNIPMRGFLTFVKVTTKVMKKVMPTK